jgi:hypothetical protein
MKLDPVETGAARYLAFETGAQLAAGMPARYRIGTGCYVRWVRDSPWT